MSRSHRTRWRILQCGFALTAVSLLLGSSIVLAAPTTGTLEPGQAPEPVSVTNVELPKQWTHREVELRGIWLPGKELLEPQEKVLAKLDALTSANFNAVFPDAYFRGYVIYPNSEYLPQFPEARGRDPLASFIEAAHQRGLQVHAWLEYGFYAYHTPDATKDKSMGPWLDAHPELVSVDSSGQRFIHNPAWGDFYSMCPANPKCHELIAGIAVEIVKRYPVEGINLDRIRFAGEKYCYCPYCREHFRKDTGLELKPFSAGSPEAKRFLEWKRAQLVKAVRLIRDRVKAVNPQIVLTSYVVPPAEKDNKAQSWDLWMKEGLLDAIAVSMYGADIRRDAQRALQILGPASSRLLCAISCEVPTAAYLTNIEEARKVTKLGQITWYSGAVTDDLEQLRSGPYAKPARPPLAQDRETSVTQGAR